MSPRLFLIDLTTAARSAGRTRHAGWKTFVIGLCVLAALMSALVRNVDAAQAQANRTRWWRAHTLDVLLTAEQLDTALNKSLRGERGYVLTQHPQSLAAFERGLADYGHLATHLRALTADNAAQQRRLGELDRRVQAFARVSRAVVSRVRANDLTGALATVRTGREREAVENASALLDEVKASERVLLRQRDASDVASSARTQLNGEYLLALLGALAVLALAAVAVALRAHGRAFAAARRAEESGRLYRLLADHSNDLIVVLSLEGVRRYVSPASANVLGFAPAELLDDPGLGAIHPDDRVATAATFRALLDGAPNPGATFRLRHAHGHHVCVEASYRLIRDPATGAPAEVIAAIRDVGRREQAELERASAETQLREANRLLLMAESMGQIGHWRVDLASRQVFWSDMVCAIHGRPRGYSPSIDNAIEAYHPDDRDIVQAAIDGAIADGVEFRFRARLITTDGAVRHVLSSGRAETGADGIVAGVFGVIQDISAQAAADHAIRASERRYRLLADNASDVVLRTGNDGSVLYISPSCAELSGYLPDELTGRPCADFIHPDDYAVVHAAHLAIVTGAEESVTVEYRLKHKYHGWRWLESHMKPWRVPDDAEGGIISAIREIEGRKALEAALTSARDAAEAAAGAKAMFLANMSHEIRTPMNGVLGFTELVLGGDLTPEQRRHVELIAESGRSMMRLLNDILDITKIELGKMVLAEEPVDLRHIARRCVDLMAPVARAKGVAFTVEIDAAVPSRIVGDPLRLRQVLLNLIGNAVKFTERGSITVAASTVGDQLRIAVADTGIGIPADRLSAIFEQFSQADPSTARNYGGSGLGLSISGELARLMGGSIAVDSAVGVGTTFAVLLPLVGAAAPAVPGVDDVHQARVDAEVGRRPRVLIAEDHDINQALITAMAERAGMTPSIAADGVAAIAMVEAAARDGTPFELVLMDMQMPRMGGLEAARRLRADGYPAATLPIVALTANAYAEDVQACLEAGMQAHLSKPVRVRDLTDILARFIGNGARSPAPPVAISPKLIDRYRARKAELFDRLDRFARAGSTDEALLGEVTDLLHKLAGTAGMFGEPELGEQARSLEDGLPGWTAADRVRHIRAVIDGVQVAA